ncbi:MAG TPA: hypothetical protein VGQ65_14960 [Thermoanaerobaculia bacterium]|jgi:hypothetical protein|nr:hypothetical protein [Thermoanaerobaculia bacterium]
MGQAAADRSATSITRLEASSSRDEASMALRVRPRERRHGIRRLAVSREDTPDRRESFAIVVAVVLLAVRIIVVTCQQR